MLVLCLYHFFIQKEGVVGVIFFAKSVAYAFLCTERGIRCQKWL